MNRLIPLHRQADILLVFAAAAGVVLLAAAVGGIYLIFRAIF